jgi:hypothetical protein
MRVAPLHGMKDGICTCGAAECERPGQHVRMPQGIADATSKFETIKNFHSRYPKAKLAIAAGVAGIIALKVTGKAAHEALAEDPRARRRRAPRLSPKGSCPGGPRQRQKLELGNHPWAGR